MIRIYWAVLKEVYKQKNISTLTASNVVKKDFVFIIDEINRGNLSKIFGELFMLIEKDKRGIELQLLYSDEKFFVPKNVYILV